MNGVLTTHLVQGLRWLLKSRHPRKKERRRTERKKELEERRKKEERKKKDYSVTIK